MTWNGRQVSIPLPNDERLDLERRGAKRHVALLRVALLHAEGAKDLCVVRNVSSNGLSARAYRMFEGGEDVEIEFRAGVVLGGRVVWERDWEFGIEFPKSIDVASVLASRWINETGKRRNLPRIEIMCPGRLKGGLRTYDVVLQDISQGGARIQVEMPTVGKDNVVLTLPDLLPLAGVASWARDTEVGISFNECLSFEKLARWIRARRL